MMFLADHMGFTRIRICFLYLLFARSMVMPAELFHSPLRASLLMVRSVGSSPPPAAKTRAATTPRRSIPFKPFKLDIDSGDDSEFHELATKFSQSPPKPAAETPADAMESSGAVLSTGAAAPSTAPAASSVIAQLHFFLRVSLLAACLNAHST